MQNTVIFPGFRYCKLAITHLLFESFKHSALFGAVCAKALKTKTIFCHLYANCGVKVYKLAVYSVSGPYQNPSGLSYTNLTKIMLYVVSWFRTSGRRKMVFFNATRNAKINFLGRILRKFRLNNLTTYGKISLFKCTASAIYYCRIN